MKNFGFGCMRLPMIDKEVDHKQFCEMIDLFMENGFTYYDTARVYIQGKSELALKNGCASRRKIKRNTIAQPSTIPKKKPSVRSRLFKILKAKTFDTII